MSPIFCYVTKRSTISSYFRSELPLGDAPERWKGVPVPSDPFEEFRSLLFAMAYRMLGSAMEAEDIVQ